MVHSRNADGYVAELVYGGVLNPLALCQQLGAVFGKQWVKDLQLFKQLPAPAFRQNLLEPPRLAPKEPHIHLMIIYFKRVIIQQNKGDPIEIFWNPCNFAIM